MSTLNVVVLVSHAIGKNQPVLLNFLRGIAKKMEAQTREEDLLTYRFAEEHPDQL